ncbi:YqgE/AlgH family protein [Marinobacter caseinilyticus]|uniref:YqgE/AlgH family protein n=1 Tax=Marinobacter caseinilyticus TaxID=2692195 RepID=UPI00140905CE|nr:YqgE/AlgH family protein [Marinobacter caseinilyticus]
MRTTNETPPSLGGHLLIATPYLGDPRFHGAIVFLCDHSEAGALGVMINRPLDISLGEILEQLDMDGGELDCPVYSGGPVEQERGFVLHTPAAQWQTTSEVAAGIRLTTSKDVLTSIGRGEGPSHYLVALGYAGWSEGQLEAELAGNAWLTCPATTDLVFETPCEKRYAAVLAHLGIDLNQLSDSIGHA